MSEKKIFEDCGNIIAKCREEVAQRLVGQKEAVDGIITALIANGHVLLEGAPGLAKTLAVKTFSDISGLSFKRIQFTPDLLPADLIGTLVFEQANSSFSVRKGPIFANLILADEINRAPAKVQSALLEAMAERQVTIGDETFPLPEPFFVLATQNPIEQEGTYALPEAELDRFLLKIILPYPTPEEELRIVQMAQQGEISKIKVKQAITSKDINKMREALTQVTCDEKIINYMVSICNVTRNPEEAAKDSFLRYISFGASPRASIALCLCAKINALFEGRDYVLPADVQQVAPAVLRHRLLLSYEAAAAGISPDHIIHQILDALPLP